MGNRVQKTKTPRPTGIECGLSFCQAPSQNYLRILRACGDDPRSVAGQQAINQAGSSAEKGWQPAWDARDVR